MSAPVTPATLKMTRVEWGLLLILAVLWGGSFFFIELSVRALPPFTVVLLRVGIAALVLNTVIRLRGLRLPATRRAWGAVAGMALLNNAIPFSLIVWGESHISSGVASILNATTPVFAVLVAHFFTSHEPLTGGRMAGVALALGGVVVMVGGAALQSLGVNVLAELACVAAAVSYAFSGLFAKPLKESGLPPLVIATAQVTTATVMMAPLAAIIDQPWTLPHPPVSALAAVVGLAVFSTAIAYTVYFRIMTRAGATNASLVTFLIPISAVVLGIAFLGETLQGKHIIGMALITLGLVAVDGRAWAFLRKAR